THQALNALNNAHAVETSHLEPEAWARLGATATLALAALDEGGPLGFLIAFDQAAEYDGTNFRWFVARYPRFAYVDRVVVDARARGQGVARALYAALADHAAAAGLERLACEVNRVPPNPGSDAFHERLGFVEVGRAHPYGDTKLVRYLALELAAAGTPSGAR
ncbi:MAG: GNAT family N-acetyltransferase, partial [Pseudomonadota bacterium]